TVSRRTVDGSLTILGDVAQATGPIVYRRWEELEPFLPDEAEVTIEELRHAYRVPGEIMELALPLLDLIAPDVERPLAYRQGGDSGLRELYVALTRPTKTLVVVHSRPFPAGLA